MKAVATLLALLCAFAVDTAAQDSQSSAIEAPLLAFSELPTAELVEEHPPKTVRSHLVGLGAMQKVRGVWRPDESERLSGSLSRFTWRSLDGYPSDALLDDLVDEIGGSVALELLFGCEGRACGDSAQWANRIFGERLLYGRAESQHYRVFAFEEAGARYRLVIYASARTSDRQYLHAELLRLASP